MASSLKDQVAARSPEFSAAYEWIAANPRTHRTQVSMFVDSDWGSFSLAVPAATIEPDPNSKAPDGTVFTNSTVRWDVPVGAPWTGRVE